MSKFKDWVYDETVEDEPLDFGTKVYNEFLDIYAEPGSKIAGYKPNNVVEDEPEYKNGIMVGKPVCVMVNVYDAKKKAVDKYYDQEFEGNHAVAAEAKKESRYYEGFLDSTECPKYQGF